MTGFTESLCVVQVGEGTFAIETKAIREVLQGAPAQRIPLAPAFVSGVVAYRGDMLAVVSLRWLLGLDQAELPGNLLVLQDGLGEIFGIAVDSVQCVVTVPSELRRPNPGTLDARCKELFDGTYRIDETLLIRIDPNKLAPDRLLASAACRGAEVHTRTEVQ